MQIPRQVQMTAVACWLAALVVMPQASSGPKAAPGGQPAAGGQSAPGGQAAPGNQAPPKPAAEAKATPDQQDFAALRQLIEGAATGQATPAADVKVGWLSNHFIRSQGDSVYIPFTMSVDRSQLPASSAALYVRAIRKDGTAVPLPGAQPNYPWDAISFIELPPDGRLSRAIALAPGTYDVLIGLKERGTPPSAKMGLLRHELMVPVLGGAELTTSSVILARSLEQLTTPIAPDKQQDNPYVYGTLKVNPSIDHVFPKSGDLQVLFWIYGASQTDGKPDVQIEFNFHQRQADGSQKYFNKTAPQEMNEKTLPQEFNLTAGHQLLSSLVIPLTSFPAGDYRLEIKVTDKPSGKAVTRDVNFQVSA